jgi:hypothetical protein
LLKNSPSGLRKRESFPLCFSKKLFLPERVHGILAIVGRIVRERRIKNEDEEEKDRFIRTGGIGRAGIVCHALPEDLGILQTEAGELAALAANAGEHSA